MVPTPKVPNMGQVIEYIPGQWQQWQQLIPAQPNYGIVGVAVMLTYVSPGRLYLASYTNPPDDDTFFPYPEGPIQIRSPSKKSRLAVDQPTQRLAYKQPFYFTVDDAIGFRYNAFYQDFGPLHIGHLCRFAMHFHDILGAKENANRPVVFWSKADPKSKPIPVSYYLSVCLLLHMSHS